MSEAAEAVSSYISFCENNIIPVKEIKLYPNNKPWITSSLKRTINEKEKAFQSGNRGERKMVQCKLRDEIRKVKHNYKEKVEAKFQSGNMRDAWCALKDLSGQCRPQ